MNWKKINKASIFFSVIFFYIAINYSLAQDIPHDSVSISKGRKLFLHNCYLCHEIQCEMLGPALVNITDKRPVDWLMKFIRDSQQLIVDKDSTAQFLIKSYNHSVMPSFYKFSNDDILSILAYIKKYSVVDFQDDRTLSEAPEAVIRGKQLFNNQCSQCHAIGHQIIGPGLASVPKTRTKAWLNEFIKNSQKVIKSGEPHANYLYNNFNQIKMPSFDFLTDEQIESILLYIRKVSESPVYVAGVNGNSVLSEDRSIVLENPQPEDVRHQGFNKSKIAVVLAGILILIIKIVLGIKFFKRLNKRQKLEI